LQHHFINHFNQECHKSVGGLSPEAEKILMAYSWPGNVRELKNVIERAMIFESEKDVLPEHLPQEILDAELPMAAVPQQMSPISLDSLVIPESGIAIEEVEQALVKKALEMAHGNQTKASQLLKMPRDAFRRRMKRFGMI
ncbi:MAG: hypothetical protein M0042_11720, partial [Nitrospiraceae bacterium]|nr:hypothetical protein [Nitrospiraceae bacterium]